MGFDPFFIHPVTGGYEVAHLTLKSTAPAGATTPQGIAIGWADGVELHHVTIDGFGTPVRADLSNGVEIHHSRLKGLGSTVGRCLEFRELNLFFPGALPPDGHITGAGVHHNDISDCELGINANNSDGTSIHHNNIMRTNTGVQLVANVSSEVHHNLIGKSALRSVNLVNANDAEYHDNVYCESPLAVRYGASVAPSLFGLPPSTDNVFHHETFLGIAEIFNATADRNLGPGNALRLEDAKKSASDPLGACPAVTIP